MSLEVKGRLVEKLAVQTGEGKNGKWEKQQFIIETDDQFPKKICIMLWGDKVPLLEKVTEGDDLTVSINIESREYNSKWYTDVKAWRIERGPDVGSAPPPSMDEIPPDTGNPEDDLPF